MKLLTTFALKWYVAWLFFKKSFGQKFGLGPILSRQAPQNDEKYFFVVAKFKIIEGKRREKKNTGQLNLKFCWEKLLISPTPTCTPTRNALSKNEILVNSKFSQVSCFHAPWNKFCKQKYFIEKQIWHAIYHQGQVTAQNIKRLNIFYI